VLIAQDRYFALGVLLVGSLVSLWALWRVWDGVALGPSGPHMPEVSPRPPAVSMGGLVLVAGFTLALGVAAGPAFRVAGRAAIDVLEVGSYIRAVNPQ
jgi:formate hydrogenlyase subunit 3/multisubunit Na+/H+ antiporter MnhD subunit